MKKKHYEFKWIPSNTSLIHLDEIIEEVIIKDKKYEIIGIWAGNIDKPTPPEDIDALMHFGVLSDNIDYLIMEFANEAEKLNDMVRSQYIISRDDKNIKHFLTLIKRNHDQKERMFVNMKKVLTSREY